MGICVKQVVLDVLKPHKPDVLVLAEGIAALGGDYRVEIEVLGVDEQTETVMINILGDNVDREAVVSIVTSLGGSVHSIDRVKVHGVQDA